MRKSNVLLWDILSFSLDLIVHVTFGEHIPLMQFVCSFPSFAINELKGNSVSLFERFSFIFFCLFGSALIWKSMLIEANWKRHRRTTAESKKDWSRDIQRKSVSNLFLEFICTPLIELRGECRDLSGRLGQNDRWSKGN